MRVSNRPLAAGIQRRANEEVSGRITARCRCNEVGRQSSTCSSGPIIQRSRRYPKFAGALEALAEVTKYPPVMWGTESRLLNIAMARANLASRGVQVGPLPAERGKRDPQNEAAEARAAGLTVTSLRTARCRMVFHDVGAIVWILRKCVWWVPDFSVKKYRHELLSLDKQMRQGVPFVAYSARHLIEAHR